MMYFLWANIYAAFFFLLYSILIKGKPSHAWSRFYLLTAMLLSIVLPLVKFEMMPVTVMTKNIPAVNLPELVLDNSPEILTRSGLGYKLWEVIYVLTAVALSLQLANRMVALKVFLGKQVLTDQEGYKLGINTGYGPASFGNIIIFPGNEVDESILEHERAHLTLKHHYDKIGIQLLRCFFFPILALHFMYRELMMIHEFEADEKACLDKEAYSKVLLAGHFKSKQIHFLQNFFHHPLKRRIKMLYKSKTTDTGRKVLLLTFSVITLTAVLILRSNPLSAQDKDQKAGEKTYSSVEQVPEYPGGMDSLVAFLSQNIRYPDSAKTYNVQGRAVVQFVVNKEGTVRDVRVIKDPGMGCGEEARRVVVSMPRWKPGRQNGENVNVYFTLPIDFQLAK